ncbi:MAG: pilus assembly protein [Chloroflexota bacterium]
MIFGPGERGQGLAEYAILFTMVALVVIVVLVILGPMIGNVFTDLNSRLASY